AESAKAAAAAIDARLVRERDALIALEQDAAGDQPDEAAAARIASLEEALAALDRDREAELARQLVELEEQQRAAAAEHSARVAAVEERAREREQGEAGVDQARQLVRDAERGVEAARREAARIGGTAHPL